jgi:surface polysaccharide O-acyltransferase-like enzyme
MASKNKFLNHIHYFRAFAIINIAIVHIWIVPFEYENDHVSRAILIIRELAFHASTLYFLFISGFLFYYLSAKSNTIKYYKSKISNVILPYIFFTFISLVLKEIFSSEKEYNSLFIFFKELILSIIYGDAQVQYWYIPFISVVFLISPFLLKIPKNTFKYLTFFFCFLPLFGLRTDTEVTIYQYIYFLPTYLIGIYAAIDYSRFIFLLKNNTSILICTASSSSFFLLCSYLLPYSPDIGPINIRESVFYVQKISMCFLAIIWMIKLEDTKNTLLWMLATYSFSIYFAHTLVGNTIFNKLYYSYIFSNFPGLVFPFSIIYVVVIFFTTFLFCIVAKKVIGKRSRFFIGV